MRVVTASHYVQQHDRGLNMAAKKKAAKKSMSKKASKKKVAKKKK
jgi:hypothetical protein